MEIKNMLSNFFWRVQKTLCLDKQSFFTVHYIPAWVSVKNNLQNGSMCIVCCSECLFL